MPLSLVVPEILREVPVMAAARRPFVISREPANEDEAVPETTRSLEMVKSPVNEWLARVSAEKRPLTVRLPDAERLAAVSVPEKVPVVAVREAKVVPSVTVRVLVLVESADRGNTGLV